MFRSAIRYCGLVLTGATLVSAATTTATRFGDGGKGYFLSVGNYPDARGLHWTPSRGPGAARRTLDVYVDELSAVETGLLSDAARRGVAVRVVVCGHEPVPDAAKRSRDRERMLAAAGVAVYRGPTSECGSYAVFDGFRVVLPDPFSDDQMVASVAVSIRDAGTAEAFKKSFDDTVTRSDRLVTEADTPQGLRAVVSPDLEERERTGGTFVVSAGEKTAADVYATFGVEQLTQVLQTEAPHDPGLTGPLDLFVYVASADVAEDAKDNLAALLDPIATRFASAIRSVSVIRESDVPEETLDMRLSVSFPGSTLRDIESSIPVRTAFTLRDGQRGHRGVSFTGTLDAGVVVMGVTPGVLPFSVPD